MEWALTSSVKVTSMNASDTNESAAALRLTGGLNLRMQQLATAAREAEKDPRNSLQQDQLYATQH
jgi:hypothetical protein